MSIPTDGYPVTQIPVEHLCCTCRFGAGLPQGPQRLMRCVNPGEPTAGQFLRGRVACEGFVQRTAVGQPQREYSGVATGA